MQVNFEYNEQPIKISNIEIENIGDFALEANDDDGLFYYLIIRTYLGSSYIVTCGPIVPNSGIILPGYSANFIEMEYKETKLISFITKWLNDKYRKITKAVEINAEDARNQFIDFQDFITNKLLTGDI